MKRYEYHIVATGGYLSSGTIRIETIHAFFDHQIEYEDIETIRRVFRELLPSYIWNVTFIMPLSEIEGRCSYLVTYKKITRGKNAEVTTETTHLYLPKPFQEYRREKAIRLLSNFIFTDNNFKYDIEVVSAELETK